ncbi:ATP-binding protein [Petroclostridium sp. X23]|uniref:sensor histidine kinase n=1 Tax=Petroclostridium sp. X23 TaxID=3045146 RepID=UPI0024ADC491|nr:ATP-binding protein [Petroclostridium sp. X23]WHH56955.1 ATP-binding protein [Petroclostridium sp. X23]
MMKDKNLIIIFTMLLQAILMIFVNQYITITEKVGIIKKLLPVANIIVALLTGFVLYSLRILGEDIKKKAEFNILKSHLQQVEGLIRTLHSQRHEYARHIQAIQAMLYLEEIENAKIYVAGLAQECKYPKEMIHTDNPALTALLNSTSEIAASKGIHFDFAIKCDLTGLDVSAWDLSSILGNLLDNALEAVIERRNSRRVGLEIKFEDNWYVFYVYSNGKTITSEDIPNIFKLGYSTKDVEIRGYGLYIVKKLVDKYHGRIELVTGKKTTFSIYLPYKEGKNDSKYLKTNSSDDG